MEKSEGKILRRHLLAGQLMLGAILIAFGLFSLYRLQVSADLTRSLYDHPLTVSNAALKAGLAISKMQQGMKDLLLQRSPEDLRRTIEIVDRLEREASAHLDIVRARILGDEGRRLEQKTRLLFTRWEPIRAEVIGLVQQGRVDAASATTTGKEAEHVRSLETYARGLTEYALAKATTFMRAAENNYGNAQKIMAALLFAGLCATALITVLTFKQAAVVEKKLKAPRQLLANAIDLAPIGMAMIRPDGRYHLVNRAFSEMVGYSEQELGRLTFQDISHPEDYDIGSATRAALLKGEKIQESLQKRYIHRDGRTIYAEVTLSLLRDFENGIPHLFFTQIKDITARIRTEAALAANEKKYRRLFENMINGFALHEIVCDDQGHPVDYVFLEVNAAFEQQTGLRRDALIGQRATAVIAGIEKDPADWIGRFGQVALNGTEMRFEQYAQFLKRHYAVLAFQTREGQFATVFEDITERRRAEQQAIHFKRLLEGVRAVNHLIVHAREPEDLIAEACRLLVKNRGCVSALMVLTDEREQPLAWAGAGMAEDATVLQTLRDRNQIPACCPRIPDGEILLVDQQDADCTRCPLAGDCTGVFSLCGRLVYGESTFGYLMVALEQDPGTDHEERRLFIEMAADLAYALNTLQVDAARKESERRQSSLEKQLVQSQQKQERR